MNGRGTAPRQGGVSPWRFRIFALALSLAALAVLVRYAVLMLGPRIARTQSSRSVSMGRGPILDRNGRILAVETRMGNLGVWRPDLAAEGDIARLAARLAPLIEMTEAEIAAKIENSAADFLYLKKQIDESTIDAIEKVQREERLPGISIQAVTGRVYPEGKLASQVIGFVGDEGAGLAGIEYAFEETLAPGSQGGSRVYLSLDINVQHILENIAEQVLAENRAEAVMLMAMDPRDGSVLGSVSLPNFDPNLFKESDETSRMDRPAIWSYEPGSVFKIFSLAALLESSLVTPESVFVCNGRYERVTNKGETLTINCLGAHGAVHAREIIIYSCNAGAAYASDREGAGDFYRGIAAFGFGSRTGAGAPGETAGFFRPPETWSERSKPTIAMGQEIGVSALQMLQAASAIANDGVLVPPRLVLRIASANGRVQEEYHAGEKRRILSAATARAMRSYMVDVTGLGTGQRAGIEDLSLAVKTGTAQIIDQKTRAYSDTDFIASCMALLPADNPSLVLYLAIIKPRGEFLGGRIAAPPIREAAGALINYLGIPRGRNPQVDMPGSIILEAPPEVTLDGFVPDFRGLPKRSLIPLLLREDITVEIAGDGWVVRQSPPAGTPLSEGMVLRLELE
ncbi:MAG: transpeptidase family protein [Treponema sp.]|jgi:cell division protein FtsI (penicillin-binding protein 3)|nr:transpeptidase family protein [Treponema sp.]